MGKESSSKQSIFINQRKKQREILEKVQKLLEDLKTMTSEQGSHDKNIEDEVCEVLQVSPESWMLQDRSLEQMMSLLQTTHDQVSVTLKQQHNLSDATVSS